MSRGLLSALVLLLLLAACSSNQPETSLPVADVATEVLVPPLSPTLPPATAAATDTPLDTAVPAQDPSPEPTEVPAATAVPASSIEVTPDPAADPEGYLAALAHTADPALVGRTWAWQQREQGGTVIVAVPDPENYTLFFQEDGLFTMQVDCNSGSGNYATTVSEDGRRDVFLMLGPRTQVACRSSSLEEAMVQLFGPARTYEVSGDGGRLQLVWDDGAVDTFTQIVAADLPDAAAGTAVGTITAPDGAFLRSGPGTFYPVLGLAAQGDSAEIVGASADGGWWQVVAPAFPGGFVWARAERLEVTEPELVPVVRLAPAAGLSGTPWEWVSTTDPEGVLRVSDPARYVVRFNEDGSVLIVADCNISVGSYTLEGEMLSVALGPATLAQCGSESLDTDFLYQLTGASTAVLQEGSLYLELPLDEARMRFVPQGAPPPPEETAIDAILGIPLTLVSFGPPGEEQLPLPGTRITATFDGSLINGESGCNTYSGALIPQDGFFTVGPLITTKKACLEPAGVMEQEQAFLAALQNTSGLQWERVRGGGGEIVTNVQTSYTLLNGSAGTLNFSSAP